MKEQNMHLIQTWAELLESRRVFVIKEIRWYWENSLLSFKVSTDGFCRGNLTEYIRNYITANEMVSVSESAVTWTVT